MCRHYALLGTTSDISPIQKHGRIGRKESHSEDKSRYKGFLTSTNLPFRTNPVNLPRT